MHYVLAQFNPPSVSTCNLYKSLIPADPTQPNNSDQAKNLISPFYICLHTKCILSARKTRREQYFETVTFLTVSLCIAFQGIASSGARVCTRRAFPSAGWHKKWHNQCQKQTWQPLNRQPHTLRPKTPTGSRPKVLQIRGSPTARTSNTLKALSFFLKTICEIWIFLLGQICFVFVWLCLVRLFTPLHVFKMSCDVQACSVQHCMIVPYLFVLLLFHNGVNLLFQCFVPYFSENDPSQVCRAFWKQRLVNRTTVN